MQEADRPDKKQEQRPFLRLIARYLLLLFKLLVSASLFYLLITKVGGKSIISNIRKLTPESFIVAIGLYLIAALLSTLRWKLLVPHTVATKRLFSMYMIGSFFNTYLPGGVGGDAVKAYYLNTELKKGPGKRDGVHSPEPEPSLTMAIASVFMDRYIGFSALLTISILAFPFGLGYLRGASQKWPVLWIIPAAALAFMIATLVIFKFRVGERMRILAKAYHYFRFYRSKPGLLGRAFLYSLAIQILGVISVYILSKGMQLSIPFTAFLVFLPIIILISMIPVSISGIGLREGAFVFLLGAMGVPPEMSMTLSIVWFLSVFFAGLWGLLEYLRYKTVLGGEVK